MEKPDTDFICLTQENLAQEHLCCIIRSRTAHPGVEAKRQWLSDRLKEGHVFRKRNVKGAVFIEYAPLEKAWVPIIGNNYLYIYCLWVNGAYKGKGYGRQLMDGCLADARAQGRSGVCMLGADKQKHWLSNQSFAEKYGFVSVDTTDAGYTLLALSFDGTAPRFAPAAKKGTIDNRELTIFYSPQCPYILQALQTAENFCRENDFPLVLHAVDTLQKAKELPGVFNNCGVFYDGRFRTVNLPDAASLKRLMNR